MDSHPDLARRSLLAGAASAVAAVGFARSAQAQSGTAPARANLPPYVAWKNADHLVVHSATTIETRRSAFGTSVIAPADSTQKRGS